MLTSITQKLDPIHHQLHTLTNEDGGRAVIWERGSRVIELVAPHRIENALWSNLSAIERDEWNSGGDRTWISPEIEFFIQANKEHAVPAQLDPGNYKLRISPDLKTVLTSQSCVLHHQSGDFDVNLHISKEHTLIPNPFAMNRFPLNLPSSYIYYVGYQCETRLTVNPTQHLIGDAYTRNSSSVLPMAYYCNLWNIMQVPAGGTALIPTSYKASPLVMFKDHGEIDIHVQRRFVTIPYKGINKFKVSFNSLESKGRFGYLLRLNEHESSLLVRQFQVNPSAIYPDFPQNCKDYIGSCMQFFFDGGQWGHFGELEYHTPAIPIAMTSSYSDISQVYYFVGNSDKISEIADYFF
jgi:hypothetical protein